MVKYVKSSERSERLAGIQRNRQQREADANAQAQSRCLNSLEQFKNTYGSRIDEVYDTWVQLVRMKEATNVVPLPSGNCILSERWGGPFTSHPMNEPSGWIETTIKFWNNACIYLSNDGTVGHHFSVPYGSMTGRFTEYDLHNADYADAVNSAVSKLPKLVEELEEYIYSIADSIED